MEYVLGVLSALQAQRTGRRTDWADEKPSNNEFEHG